MMYKLVPKHSLGLKTYWCSDLQVAQEVADEMHARFGCEIEITEDSTRQCWLPGDLMELAMCCPRNLMAFPKFRCSKEQLRDAVSHATGSIVKIKDDQEIFCFKADESFWQRQYLYDQTH